ncbi:unnamed protein product [Diatraea saccharalis]|uniref:RNA-directed DNA polymerase n=1 Tax=Diatraea saccharalis TaxID=40085 RepID=A0A9N9QXF5_9NEOP|nr:unnamed protein product [Diatraea saccharalis]
MNEECHLNYETSATDLCVPRVEGQGHDVVDVRQGEPSYATWPGRPRYEGQAKSRRRWSEQPGVSRVRDTEVANWVHSINEKHQEHEELQCQRTDKRHLSTPEGTGRSRSVSRESGELKLPNPKKVKTIDPTDKILDKVMAILQSVKSSEKPRLAFDTNIVPEFDPMSREQTILTWLTKVEECAEIYGWEDREIIHYALPKLTGVARSWYRNLPTIMYTWIEWKRKLIQSFPVREDYAELLTEMLAKRVKYGESLDHYYYTKINLLNRCGIHGRQAVDCIIYGVDDRSIKIGAQAAQFTEPEQVLKYFRTVKVGHSRENHTIKSRNDRRGTSFTTKANDSKITCYNCDQTGHPSYKCDKPVVKCTSCEKLGHLSMYCYKKRDTNKDREKDVLVRPRSEQQVAQLNMTEESTAKYIINIKVNDHLVDCQLDLGSQCSLIKLTKAKEFNLDMVISDDLPTLRGIGGNLISPVGVAIASIEVQNIKEILNLYVVEDYVIKQSVLLGHSFTEKPNIFITKTPTAVIFKKISSDKIHLNVSENIEIPSNTLRAVQVYTDGDITVNVYVNGSVRGPEGKEYYLLPGEYEIKKGYSTLLIHNASPSSITLKKGTLLTRVRETDVGGSKVVLNSCTVTFNETRNDDILNCNEKLSDIERLKFRKLLQNYKDCFSSGLKDLGFTNLTEMVIELEDSVPIVYRPYRMPYADRILVRSMVQEMIEHGIVRESTSPYASPIVLVQKKSGDKRLCVDYRALNRKTKKEHYPLPRIEDQLDQLAGNKIFTSLDLASGYYQIPIAEESKHKTAFVTPDGQYEYNRMPFGLVNAPSVFQRTINKILLEARVKFAIVYMDDVLIPARDFDEGIRRLEEVLGLLKRGGLTLRLNKCNFFMETIDFLGYEVSAEGIRPGCRKIEAVTKFPKPRNQHEVRQFLGLSGYFRRFILHYALLAAPLTNLLKKDAKWSWDDSQDCAFSKIKAMLTNRPVLALYNHDAETQLHTDASKEGLAGILLQANSDGVFQPVSYFSRKTNADERKFHSYDLETLAVIASLNRFRVYLIGIPFKIFTDCNALRSTMIKRELIPRIARWWIQLQEYDCVIEYRPGARMSHVDALSRNPVDENTVETPTHIDVLAIQQCEDDWISTVQSADEEVKKIKDILSDPDSEQVMDIRKNYKLKNNRVFKIVGDEIKWLVPKGVRWQILKMNHDDVGHCGYDKTLSRIRKNFWFAKMRKFVKKYVTSCLECAHHKTPGGKREGELHPIDKPSIPFHTVHADHLGPFVKSKNGNCYLLILVDGFTKFVNIKPVKDTKSSTTIRLLKDHISHFGVPTRLITDKGTSFTSGAFKEFIMLYGIKHIINAVSTPRANGQVERFNRTILNALSTSSHGKDEKSWDKQIPDIQLGLNTTTHKTTQKSPSELLFGFNIKCKSENILSEIFDDTVKITSAENLKNSRDEARIKICKEQTKDAERFNSRRKVAKQYSVGDLVRVERQVPHDGQSQKLVVKYQGPYRVIKALRNDRYVIEDTPLSRKHNRRYEAIVAVDKMQPWLNFHRNLDSDSSGEGYESENN